MESKSDVVVVSGYGRGHWLALELKALGLGVILIDVSENIGRLPPDDIEGPLGLFLSDNLPSSFRARLDSEDYTDSVEDGFVLWLKSGPIDVRGSHSAQLLAQNGISADVRNYVEQYDQLSNKQRAEQIKKWKNSAFSEVWFALLAHSLGSPAATEQRDSFEYGRPLPLFAPYEVRRVTRRGAEKSLEALNAAGIQVLMNAKITDIALRGREMLHVEIASSWSGVVGGECFVWALTSEETAHLSSIVAPSESANSKPRFVDSLFPTGVLRSEWIWQRYRFEISGEPILASLPLKFLVIEDEALPWSHANMIWAQKTVTPGLFDIWMRVPTVHRFLRSYHEELAREAMLNLKTRMPGAEIKLSEYPQEYTYDEKVLGPARFQSYNPRAWRKHRPYSFKNVHFDGPECYEMIDWNGQVQYQRSVFEEIKSWKTERDIKNEKLRLKEQEKKR
jgi:hypothetical protein